MTSPLLNRILRKDNSRTPVPKNPFSSHFQTHFPLPAISEIDSKGSLQKIQNFYSYNGELYIGIPPLHLYSIYVLPNNWGKYFILSVIKKAKYFLLF